MFEYSYGVPPQVLPIKTTCHFPAAKSEHKRVQPITDVTSEEQLEIYYTKTNKILDEMWGMVTFGIEKFNDRQKERYRLLKIEMKYRARHHML